MVSFLNSRSSDLTTINHLSKYSPAIILFSIAIFFTTSAQVTVPSAPTLLYPDNGQINYSTGYSLGWNESAWATWYNLQLSTDSSFVVMYKDTTLIGTSISMRELFILPGAKYYWRVNAENSVGVSPWSATWLFSMLFNSPVLKSPLNYQTDVSASPVLEWNSEMNAATYGVQLSKDSTFKSQIIDDSMVTDTSRMVGPLLANTIYFWRVYAKSKWGVSSNWSGIRAFATAPSTAIIYQGFTSLCSSLFYSGHIIKYELPATLNVSMKILDLQGKVVWHLASTTQNAGHYCQNINHSNLKPGQYFLKFKAGGYSVIKKISMID